MKNIKLIIIVFVIFSSVFLGCIQPPPAPGGTPTPTPTATETVKPTEVPTTPAPTPIPTPARVQAVYKFYVDDIDGFYRVRALNTTQIPEYTNYTIKINAGDKVIWESESENYTITILSEQELWDRNDTSAKLRWNNQQFNYTFNQSGTYGIYVREFPKIRHQKIVVNP